MKEFDIDEPTEGDSDSDNDYRIIDNLVKQVTKDSEDLNNNKAY